MGIKRYVYPNRKRLETQNDALINQMYPTVPAIVSSTAQHKTGNTVDSTPNNMVGKDISWIGVVEEKSFVILNIPMK